MGDATRLASTKPFNFLSMLSAPLAAAQGAVKAVSAPASPKQTSSGYVGSGASQGYAPPASSSYYSDSGSSASNTLSYGSTGLGSSSQYGANGSTGSNTSGSSGGSAMVPVSSNSGGVSSNPTLSAVAPKPPSQTDYDSMVAKYVDQWGGSLGNTGVGSSDYAAAARGINNRITHATDANREGIVGAYSRALQAAGNVLAARQLNETGLLDSTILPANPATAKPATETIVIPDAKTDSLYRRQAADLAAQLSDFSAEQQLGNQQYDRQYADALRKLGWSGDSNQWDSQGTGAYGQSTTDNLDDFVGRGLGWSGLLAQGQQQIDRKFNEQKTDLDRQAGDFDDTQKRQYTSFENRNKASVQQALDDAINRIASQYGVNRNQVKVGSTNSVTREKA